MSNYFIGSDSSKWLTDVSQYSSLTYQGVYPGIDLVLHSNSAGSQEFEYDFVLQPGGNASEIQLDAQGVQGLSVDAQGRLLLSTPGGDVLMDSPVLYQTINGQRQIIAGNYVLGPNDNLGFEVTGSYDHSQPLVIDPTLNYSTYLGGSLGDSAFAVALDGDENSYITGMTFSSNFPTTTYGYQTAFVGSSDIFVTKLNASGTSIVYSTFLGGSTREDSGGMGGLGGGGTTAEQCGKAIAVDSHGDAVVAGWTQAGNYPTTSGAYDNAAADALPQAVVTKLNACGDSLKFSTYLGTVDGISGVAIDSTGVYVTGVVAPYPASFPTTSEAFQPYSSTDPAPYSDGYDESTNVFVTKLNSCGSSLIYSSFLNGTNGSTGVVDGTWTGTSGNPDGDDEAVNVEGGISIDSSGDAFVTGVTTSTNFPVTIGQDGLTSNGYLTSLPGSSAAFVSEVNPDGTALLYSTYLGGAYGSTAGHGIKVDSSGNVYVTGETTSSYFPTTSGVLQTSFGGGGSDAFVTKLNSSLSSLVYSTYLGGSYSDYGYAIAVDSDGEATVTGMTNSSNFPIYGYFLSTDYGINGAFVTRLTSSGTMSYSSYIGATSTFDLGGSAGYGVALDSDGHAYVAGTTSTTSLVGVGSGSYQNSNAGYYDAFVLEVLP